MRSVQVILRASIANLGEAGQIVEVADGYGRNYLIPRGLAEPATPSLIKALQEQERQQARKRERQRQEAEALAARLNGLELQLPVRAGAGGRLFGSVTAQDIAEALAREGFAVDRRKIELPEPIRQLGQTRVNLRLMPGVSAQILVRVVGEGQAEGQLANKGEGAEPARSEAEAPLQEGETAGPGATGD